MPMKRILFTLAVVLTTALESMNPNAEEAPQQESIFAHS